MTDEIEKAEAFAAGMAVVALEDAFIDLVELLLRDETLRRVEVQALRPRPASDARPARSVA